MKKFFFAVVIAMAALLYVSSCGKQASRPIPIDVTILPIVPTTACHYIVKKYTDSFYNTSGRLQHDFMVFHYYSPVKPANFDSFGVDAIVVTFDSIVHIGDSLSWANGFPQIEIFNVVNYGEGLRVNKNLYDSLSVGDDYCKFHY